MTPPRLRWTERPRHSTELPALAAAVWLPDGPALATILPSISQPGRYIVRLDRMATAICESPRACSEWLASTIEAAFAADRSARDAN